MFTLSSFFTEENLQELRDHLGLFRNSFYHKIISPIRDSRHVPKL